MLFEPEHLLLQKELLEPVVRASQVVGATTVVRATEVVEATTVVGSTRVVGAARVVEPLKSSWSHLIFWSQ